MAKKKISKKEVKESCDVHGHCHHGMCLGKLSTIALVLFLITVWPGLLNCILKVSYKWYLSAFILLVILKVVCRKHCCCKK